MWRLSIPDPWRAISKSKEAQPVLISLFFTELPIACPSMKVYLFPLVLLEGTQQVFHILSTPFFLPPLKTDSSQGLPSPGNYDNLCSQSEVAQPSSVLTLMHWSILSNAYWYNMFPDAYTETCVLIQSDFTVWLTFLIDNSSFHVMYSVRALYITWKKNFMLCTVLSHCFKSLSCRHIATKWI